MPTYSAKVCWDYPCPSYAIAGRIAITINNLSRVLLLLTLGKPFNSRVPQGGEMDWLSIIAGLFAGGFGGQLVTLFLTERSAARREFQSWLRDEQFKTFSELLDLVSSFEPRDEYEKWPAEIRRACQKVHLLCDEGKANDELSDAMEKVFQLSKKKRDGEVKDDEAWRAAMRNEARILRESFAKLLKDSKPSN